MQEIKFTTVRVNKGQFVVVKDGEKYFLEYLQTKGNQTGKVGYLIKEEGTWYLQEAFFDKLNYPHFNFRSVFRPSLSIDDEIRKDLFDNLVSACYQIEEAINNKGKKSATYMTGNTKRKWATLIHALKNGSELETAVRTLRDGLDMK